MVVEGLPLVVVVAEEVVVAAVEVEDEESPLGYVVQDDPHCPSVVAAVVVVVVAVPFPSVPHVSLALVALVAVAAAFVAAYSFRGDSFPGASSAVVAPCLASADQDTSVPVLAVDGTPVAHNHHLGDRHRSASAVAVAFLVH